jgi:hypothetical protein
MKTKQILILLTILSLGLFISVAHADDITCTNSGNWSDPAIWMNSLTLANQVPSTNDSVDVRTGFVVTVDTNAACGYLYSSDWDPINSIPGGTVVMGAGVTLDIYGDTIGAQGSQGLGFLDAQAVGNTVVYHGNAFWAKRTNYWNLAFTGAGDFYNGAIPSYGAVPMTIAGDMTLGGNTNVAVPGIRVQQGADISIGGNLNILGFTNKWDSSSFQFTVASNLSLLGTNALLIDLDGALGSNYIGGNLTVGPNALGWNITDVAHWYVGGSLTNSKTIVGSGYGTIHFVGAGVIAGKPFKIPTMTVEGTYTIGTTITLATNAPDLNGTLIFDLAAAPTNKIILIRHGTNLPTIYYNGNLDVVNSGGTPGVGATYKFFSATNYDGAFANITLPSLGGSLGLADNLLASGSFLVVGDGGAGSTLNYTSSGNSMNFYWDTNLYAGYTMQALTNQLGVMGTNWVNVSGGGASPFSLPVNHANPSVFFRLYHP